MSKLSWIRIFVLLILIGVPIFFIATPYEMFDSISQILQDPEKIQSDQYIAAEKYNTKKQKELATLDFESCIPGSKVSNNSSYVIFNEVIRACPHLEIVTRNHFKIDIAARGGVIARSMATTSNNEIGFRVVSQ